MVCLPHTSINRKKKLTIPLVTFYSGMPPKSRSFWVKCISTNSCKLSCLRWKLHSESFYKFCLLLPSLLSNWDGDDDVRVWDPLSWESEVSAWEARNSSAIAMSLMSGRKLDCSQRHIAVIATARCRLRTEKRPSKEGPPFGQTSSGP